MKKLIKKYWKIMVVIVILGIFVLLFFLVRYKGKKNLEANIAAEQQDVFEEMASFQNTIDYHGTTYQYRKDIVNILCIGVDKEEAMWERDDDGGSVGQADAVFLVSFDFEHSNIRILAIPRDTMVSIVACDENGNGCVYRATGIAVCVCRWAGKKLFTGYWAGCRYFKK